MGGAPSACKSVSQKELCASRNVVGGGYGAVSVFPAFSRFFSVFRETPSMGLSEQKPKLVRLHI
jgi:hypothetical protein